MFGTSSFIRKTLRQGQANTVRRFNRPLATKVHDEVRFPGAPTSKTCTNLNFEHKWPTIPVYRVLSRDGKILVPSQEPVELANNKELLLKVYKEMVTLNVMDQILYEAQRQGRISFYMTSYGEEATHMGSAAALQPDDEVFAQYREQGVLMHRGFTLDEFMNQCYSTDQDIGKGRQMPVHYGSAKYHYQTISSPLGTQIPQAAGAGYMFRLAAAPRVAMCYFGDGSASEGDFHAALNMAATTKSQTIFFCRNNGYAISTPAVEQYKGDGIASRGRGYGIATTRVDGNDFFAVYNAVREARRRCIENQEPALIEALTYRIGHHSTSDDSSAYRSQSEVKDFKERDNPVSRFRLYLEEKGYWKRDQDSAMRKEIRKAVLTAFAAAEKRKKPAIGEMFTDVLASTEAGMDWNLKEQRQEVLDAVKAFPDEFPTDMYKDGAKGI